MRSRNGSQSGEPTAEEDETIDPRDPHHDTPVLVETTDGAVAVERALLLLHGRGATAGSIMELGRALADFLEPGPALLVAPQAAARSWYPGSFLEPLERNQPWLDSALRKVAAARRELAELGVASDRQIVVGFSQGACLASEFVARNPRRYGGLIAFTGGILGPLGEERSFRGDLAGTPVLFSSGDPDPHVPMARVRETARQFEQMNARVELARHPGRPHTILPEEIALAARVLQRVAGAH